MRDWIRAFERFGGRLGGPQPTAGILVLILTLLGIGYALEGLRWARGAWLEMSRPKASFQRTIGQGLAISLKELERDLKTGRPQALPAIDIRGVLIDQDAQDWVVFGDRAARSRGLPLDAIILAMRTVRDELEPPGIDIRPQGPRGERVESPQQVTYYGGVKQTEVGQWFFEFDSWMKRNSLGQAEAAFPGLSDYWHTAVSQLEQEAANCHENGGREKRRCNRYWLETGEFTAIEGDHTLAFKQTPLQVSVESAEDGNSWRRGAKRRPGAVDDALAVAYADRLTKLLPRLAGVLPVNEIQEFSRLVAGFSWLSRVDPYHDLTFWSSAPTRPVETPETVSNLVMLATRDHELRTGTGVAVHTHSLELSGGVLVAPRVFRFRVADSSLRRLREAVLNSRPSANALLWSFQFNPSTNSV